VWLRFRNPRRVVVLRSSADEEGSADADVNGEGLTNVPLASPAVAPSVA
jgi:hypothetical protein